MRRYTLFAPLAFLLATGACGDDEKPTTVDCTWFAGDNCWRQSVDAALVCTDSTLSGTFDGTRTACDYSDGVSIAFDTPVPTDVTMDYAWSFSVSDALGDPCLTFEEVDNDTESSLALTTSIGTFRQDLEGFNVVMTCPDGSRYQIGAFAALECDWSTLPGYTTYSSGSTVGFGLLGTDVADAEVFTCTAP